MYYKYMSLGEGTSTLTLWKESRHRNTLGNSLSVPRPLYLCCISWKRQEVTVPVLTSATA